MDNNRYFIYRRSEVFFVWANYQKWRQRFSILQQRSVFFLVCRRRHGESRTGGDTSGRSARRWEEWLFEEKEKKGKDRGGGKRWPGFLCLFAPERKPYLKVAHHFSRGEHFGTAVATLPSPPLPSFVHCEWSIDQKFYHDKNGGKTKENITLIYAIIALGITFRRPTCRPSLCNAIWKKRGYLFSLIEFTPYECNEEEQLKDG